MSSSDLPPPPPTERAPVAVDGLPPLPSPAAPPPAPVAPLLTAPVAEPPRAGFGGRLGASLIDAVVAAAIQLPFAVGAVVLLRLALDRCYTTRVGGSITLHCDDGALDVPFLIGAIAVAAVGLLLALFVHVRRLGRGQTSGLRAIGARLVDATDGRPVGTGRALLRTLASIVSALPCLLGFAWMLWDSRSQTWHDKLARTLVIKG